MMRLRSMVLITRTAVVATVVAMVGAGMCGCQKNAATGRQQFIPISPQEEIALGVQAQPELVKEFGGKVARNDLQAYVTNIGASMTRHTEADYPKLPWEFTLLNSNIVNAFALPGGKVFITRGLAQRMTNEAQMAMVLGHEIGHVTGRHTGERMGQALIAQIGVVAVSAATKKENIQKMAENAAEIFLLGYSRDQESESDYLGMRYMTKVGYDPAAGVEVMQILASVSGNPSQRQPEWTQSHPYPEERIKRIQTLLATEFKATQNNPKYQKFPDRFRTNFKSKLAMLPPAPDAPTSAIALAGLGDPVHWCGHCAAAAKEKSGKAQAVGNPQ